MSSVSGTERYVVFGLMIGACLIRLGFWTYTDRTWEDALITVLHAENLWQGIGLTHLRLDGVPVHGFTSPISVLVPVIGGALDLHGTYALPFIKLVSALAAPLALWLAWLVARATIPTFSGRLIWLTFSFTYLAFEHHQILWGMAGMETQMVVATVFFAFWACANPTALRVGSALALALYARPDYAFLNIVICAHVFLFVDRKMALKAIAIGAAMYAPWLIFTTLYYGSPIPNTVLAKQYGYAAFANPWLSKFFDLFSPLSPSFAGHGFGSFQPVFDNGVMARIVTALAAIGMIFAIKDKVKALYVPVAFVVVYAAYYIFFVSIIFGWYVVPFVATAVFLAGYGLVRIVRFAGERLSGVVGAAVAVSYAGAILFVAPQTMEAEREIQRQIEKPVRQEMGLYLNKIMKTNERVALEPLGYVSYYSRRSVLDYPGLVNPEVVAYNREVGPSWICGILEHFRPEYVFARENECDRVKDWLSANYRLIDEFRATPKARKIYHSGWNVDRHFRLYQRRDLTAPARDHLGQPLVHRSDAIIDAAPDKLGEPLPLDRTDISDTFAAGGWPVTIPAPPVGDGGWASWTSKGDVGVGKLALEFRVPDGTTSIAIPIITGPTHDNTSFIVMDASGTQVDGLYAIDGATNWRLWRVDLPSPTTGTYTVQVTDEGTTWGEWAGIGRPHALSAN